jgi:signal transduction histidine kinase
MLGRLGFAGRLFAILMFALIALWALGAGLSFIAERPLVAMPARLPLPHQVAAVVGLLDQASARERDLIVTAATSDTLSVRVDKKPPVESRRLKGVEGLVRRYTDALGAREVVAFADSADIARLGEGQRRRFWRMARRPLIIAVALKDGQFAVFETRGEIVRRLFGMPPGFWLGMLGSVVGIAALLAVWREARPLHELSRAVQRFSGDGQTTLVTPRGAPELKRLIGAVNEMQQRIATLLAGRTVLLGAVSHDMKTYITRFRLRAELIADAGQRERMERDLDEMAALVDDTLAVARGASGRSRTEPADIASVVRAAADDHPTARVDVVGELPAIAGDPAALRRMFANLIGNAVRYGDRCEISIARNGGAVEVTIDDHGPGIPARARSLVMEPFYRLEPSRNRFTGGSGLGLAIAKEIAEAHGGSIRPGDAPSGGLRVVVTLPVGSGAPGAA